jgi:muconolactone delta-isomerase
MNYLMKATPTQRILALTADEHDELMAGEREVATALITAGTIVWIRRLPSTTTSLTIWDAGSEEALGAHFKTLPLFPYLDAEITALSAHPAFPTALSAASLRLDTADSSAGVEG